MINAALFILSLVRKCMRTMSNKPSLEIKTIVTSAIKNAIHTDVLEAVYLEGKQISDLKKATIWVGDIFSLKFLLIEISKRKHFDFLTQAEITRILNHENAHANMAEIVGAIHAGYEIIINKRGKDFYIAPFALVDYPDDWLQSKEKILNIIRIFNAPNEYGDRTSFSDDRRIEKLRNLISTIH